MFSFFSGHSSDNRGIFHRTMSAVKSVMFLVLLTFLRMFNSEATQTCVFMESCLLSCTFLPGDEELVHWLQETSGDASVHSYYNNQDQLAHQDPRFKNRTSLFKDQISSGNASLLLTRVEVQDQGRYKCYTSTLAGNNAAFIDLNVEAPVRRVDIREVENRITCSSEGIYPKPGLTWSSSPLSRLIVQYNPTVQETKQQLYNINSYLLLSDNDPDLLYSCTVSTGRSRRRSTLFKTTRLSGSKTETKIPCTTPNTTQTDLVWRFNHSQIILTQTRADGPYSVSEGWRQQVESVTPGSLTLKDLSSAQEGKYTCEVSTAEETYVTNTFLRIQESPGNSASAGLTAGLLVGATLLIAAAIGLIIYCKKKKDANKERPTESPMEVVDHLIDKELQTMKLHTED